MVTAAGEYTIGKQVGRLLVRTARQGVAARVGHDLLIEATEWEGHVTVPADPATQPTAVSVRVDLGTLKVLEGTGGVKPLSDGDRQQIQQTMHKLLRVDQHRYATFTSTSVEIHDDSATVEGDLTLVGQTRPLRLEVRQRDDGSVEGVGSVVQSRWGIKPYSGFFGALKLRDAVDIEITTGLQKLDAPG
ncbi:YceI family protein [Streptomyces sp. NPDC047860]|uniref:YceI family protein n=1 Tax=Streptomyces sp. NPDC047860 TaxID=3155743 RepID=UPI0033F80E2A